jgi:hypothetical protein
MFVEAPNFRSFKQGYDYGYELGHNAGFKEGFEWAMAFCTPLHSLGLWLQKVGKKFCRGYSQ